MKKNSVFVALVATALPVAAAQVFVPMDLVFSAGAPKRIGTVVISESPHGLIFTPTLENLPPGLHGFHIHEKPDCGPAEKDGKLEPAQAAGGHYDPKGTKRHSTPWGDGHLGDLPLLAVGNDGKAHSPVLAPRLTMKDVRGRSLMIHSGGDTYSDQPSPLGGGGARIACGVIENG